MRMKTERCEWLEIQQPGLAAVLCRSRLQTSYLWFFSTNCLQVFEGCERTYRLCVCAFCASAHYLAFPLDSCVQSFMWESFYWREKKRILNLILFGSFYFYGKCQHILAERSFFAAVLVLSPSPSPFPICFSPPVVLDKSRDLHLICSHNFHHLPSRCWLSKMQFFSLFCSFPPLTRSSEVLTASWVLPLCPWNGRLEHCSRLPVAAAGYASGELE